MTLVPLQSQQLDVPLADLLRRCLVLEVQVVSPDAEEELDVSFCAAQLFHPVLKLPFLPIHEYSHYALPLRVGEGGHRVMHFKLHGLVVQGGELLINDY